MMSSAVIAAAASIGGKEAEKQYPAPERRWIDIKELLTSTCHLVGNTDIMICFFYFVSVVSGEPNTL